MQGDRTEVPVVSDDLAVVRADFPAYQIWQEEGRSQPRYVARSRAWRLNPHTVVTSDLAELRDALSPAHSAADDSLASTGPNIARMYDYWLDGKDHFAADRAADRLCGTGMRSAGVGAPLPHPGGGGRGGSHVPGVDAPRQLPGDQRGDVDGHRPGTDPAPARRLRRLRARDRTHC
jgi:S-adenosyl methyltransferase